MKGLIIIVIAGLQAILCTSHTPRRHSAQQRLMDHLFKNPNYDRRARPVIDSATPISVTIRLNLYQLVEVVYVTYFLMMPRPLFPPFQDERNQHVVIYVWVTQMWNDSLLTWTPEQFENITSLVVPYRDIWLPDTYLYNSLQMSRQDSERWISAILEVNRAPGGNRQSKVVFRYPALFRFMCHMRVTNFPFDTQHCRIIFGSWTFDSSKMVFAPETQIVAQEDYQENEEWAVVGLTARQQSEFYTCCPNPFSFVYVDIVLKRRPLHYMVNLFVPILIVSIIANIGFFAPSSTSGEREQRVGLGMSTLLALSIILMMVSDKMPITSTSVPLVGRFFVGIMLETAVALLATTIVLFIHQRGNYGHRVPPWIRRVMFQYAAKILKVERSKADAADAAFNHAVERP